MGSLNEISDLTGYLDKATYDSDEDGIISADVLQYLGYILADLPAIESDTTSWNTSNTTYLLMVTKTINMGNHESEAPFTVRFGHQCYVNGGSLAVDIRVNDVSVWEITNITVANPGTLLYHDLELNHGDTIKLYLRGVVPYAITCSKLVLTGKELLETNPLSWT